MAKAEDPRRLSLAATAMVAAAVLVAGCGAKHTVGDTVIYDPEAESSQAQDAPEGSASEEGSPEKGDEPPEGGAASGPDSGSGERAEGSGDSTKARGSSEPSARKEGGEGGDATETDGQADNGGGEAPDEPTKPEQAGQFMEAKGTSVGDEEWLAEIRGEGEGQWLASPYGPAATYAMVRAATYLQGLRMAEEDREARRFTTTRAYKAWHGDNEGGWSLTMKVLTKGFGKDARYRFRVSVDPRDAGGSRVSVDQYREVMEEEPHQDVGDWVEADGPDPEITRKYLEGVQRAIGE
ncbi:hypothetical protein [Thiohalorhabdus sp.]|uniref:hypothetical protein n=1 Tax=Thiohalorhabdus sp. TaxID=3094134 RepID=UPI002FC302B8